MSDEPETVKAVADMGIDDLRKHAVRHGLGSGTRGWSRVDLVTYHSKKHLVECDHQHVRHPLPPIEED